MAFMNQYGYAPQAPMYPTYLPQQGMQDQTAQMRAPQQYAPQMGSMQMPQQMQPQQPQQCSPIWVQGEAGAKSFLVAPGQSLILMDSEAEVFYIKATDMAGVPQPLRIFDYKERSTGSVKPVQAAQAPAVDYVTRSEFEALAARIAELTAKPDKPEPQTTHSRRRPMREEDMIDG